MPFFSLHAAWFDWNNLWKRRCSSACKHDETSCTGVRGRWMSVSLNAFNLQDVALFTINNRMTNNKLNDFWHYHFLVSVLESSHSLIFRCMQHASCLNCLWTKRHTNQTKNLFTLNPRCSFHVPLHGHLWFSMLACFEPMCWYWSHQQSHLVHQWQRNDQQRISKWFSATCDTAIMLSSPFGFLCVLDSCCLRSSLFEVIGCITMTSEFAQFFRGIFGITSTSKRFTLSSGVPFLLTLRARFVLTLLLRYSNEEHNEWRTDYDDHNYLTTYTAVQNCYSTSCSRVALQQYQQCY